MRLSVVIATRNRAAYLERALESFSKQIGAPSYEVIVVDNGSTDETAPIVERANAAFTYDVGYVYEERPNRGAARNRGVAIAQGHLTLFCDDDVYVPPGFLAAHDAAHRLSNYVVSGPILNVSSYALRPKPSLANYSRAFFCTCNVSVPRVALDAVGGFDEDFHLYGWEDTELGIRLREHGMRARFAWDAYLWHIKTPQDATLESEMRKAMERARMAVRFLRKNASARVRSATGAYTANLLRAKPLERALPWFAGVTTDERMPPAARAAARAQLLDALYTIELAHALEREKTRATGE